MAQLKVATRYAKSLLNISTEMNLGDAVKADMELVHTTLQESRDLGLLLKSPIIREDKKAAILNQIFNGKISDVSSKFITLLVKKGRESALEEICGSYLLLHRTLNNVQRVTLISAVPLDATTKKQILDKLPEEGKTFDVVEQINPELIGGFIVKIGDKQIDTSVLGSFRKLKKEFKNNPFVANF